MVKGLQIALTGILILSVWSWQPDVMRQQVWLQLFISLILLVFVIYHLKQSSLSAIVSVDTDGHWLWLDRQTTANIQSSSKISQFVLWVYLQEADGKRHWLWIFKDAVKYEDFRRLSRIILQMQKHPVEH
nr:protein YgfX [Neptunicella marina]